MNFIFASDSFKGSLSSAEIGKMLKNAAEEVFPGCGCMAINMADGGEGTAEAVIEAAGGSWKYVTASDPLGRPRKSAYGALPSQKGQPGACIVEMAAVSGLTLLENSERNPEKTSTEGTGALIKAALEEGFRDITVAIGGSATNDGGMGCMRALGVKFKDGQGRELQGRGEDLIRLETLDLSAMSPHIEEAKFTVMCDVENPLLGPMGATYTFGGQKGADEAMKARLEEGMKNYAAVLRRTFGEKGRCDFPGAGAAGGLGAALKIFLGAEMKSGAESLLDMVNFDEKLETADMVISGEGRIDLQSAGGKVVAKVGGRCKKAGVPCIALVGSMGEGVESMLGHVDSIFTLSRGPCSAEYAMENARELYRDAAFRMFRLIKAARNCK